MGSSLSCNQNILQRLSLVLQRWGAVAAWGKGVLLTTLPGDHCKNLGAAGWLCVQGSAFGMAKPTSGMSEWQVWA